MESKMGVNMSCTNDKYKHDNNLNVKRTEIEHNKSSAINTMESCKQIVMTPICRTKHNTTILIERKLLNEINDRIHVGGGDHSGIIINKDIMSDNNKRNLTPPLFSIQFFVYLINSNTTKHLKEIRTLKFWFKEDQDKEFHSHIVFDFFRNLINPKDFPRDYVGFIKKTMKLLQKGYREIHLLEVALSLVETPAEMSTISSQTDLIEKFSLLTAEKMLNIIEDSYPNPITEKDFVKNKGWMESHVLLMLSSLKDRGDEDNEIKVVKQMPDISINKQPTIAIITTQYSEKLAVDIMLENKETFVRYTTVGEWNIYTLGNIGKHRIVSTKLPFVGSSREAMISTGNTITRLLGTFQKVDYIFVVGVATGVKYYTQHEYHVNLGDVVISCPNKRQDLNEILDKSYIYIDSNADDVKIYSPLNACLQHVAEKLIMHAKYSRPWETYLNESLRKLMEKFKFDFNHPDISTDKLVVDIGNNEVIEVSYPIDFENIFDNISQMKLHLGPIGHQNDYERKSVTRTNIAERYGLLAIDIGLSSVLDSIIGNCRDSFIIVEGIFDYNDGISRKWHNFASLSAASVVKSLVAELS